MPSETALAVLDLDQLRDVCMEDAELMRDLATSLIDDTASHIPELAEAVEQADSPRCARLAHYVKGACANVGAASMAALLKTIELDAKAGDLAPARFRSTASPPNWRSFPSKPPLCNALPAATCRLLLR